MWNLEQERSDLIIARAVKSEKMSVLSAKRLRYFQCLFLHNLFQNRGIECLVTFYGS